VFTPESEGSFSAYVLIDTNDPDPISGVSVSLTGTGVFADIDGDGMADDWEMEHFGKLDRDGNADWVDDGLTDREEFENDTHPKVGDADNDGMQDGWEVDNNLNPIVDDASNDADEDGFSNLNEYQAGTNPQDDTSVPSHPVIVVSPASHDFGCLPVGAESDPFLVDISNSGDADLYISSLTLTGTTHYTLELSECSDFYGDTAPLQPGGGCSVSVVFNPASGGTFNEYLMVESNDPFTPSGVSVFLTGTGVSADIDGDCDADLQDAIMALQMLIGVPPTATINLSGDVNGDGKISMEEAIHILQRLAGSQMDLNEGLVAHYPFNGNVNDESGNGNDGTAHGTTLTEDRFGNMNGAYYFDGVDDRIQIPGNTINGTTITTSL